MNPFELLITLTFFKQKSNKAAEKSGEGDKPAKKKSKHKKDGKRKKTSSSPKKSTTKAAAPELSEQPEFSLIPKSRSTIGNEISKMCCKEKNL